MTINNLLPPAVVVTEEEDNISADNPQADFIRWHYLLGHVLLNKLHLLSALGVLPQHPLTVKTSKCSGYLYGAIHRCPWMTKSPHNYGKFQQVTSPGEFISVYQLDSSTPGFISKIKIRTNNKRYLTTAILKDHHNDIYYVRLQKTLLSEDTVYIVKKKRYLNLT